VPTLGIAAFNPNRDLAQRGNPHLLSPIHQESPAGDYPAVPL
jgi:hypothetical protein